jgi:hypothetical protein
VLLTKKVRGFAACRRRKDQKPGFVPGFYFVRG